jgi:DNA-binding MarR family transcriptional regulator
MLIQQLNLKISYSTFNKFINNLLDKEIIKKRKVSHSNQTFPSTFISLTTKGKNDYNLLILEIQTTTNKNRILYQLLLFFQCYKRTNLLSERQFKYFLKK